MANVKKGTLTRSPQWWKHLRDWKRAFWKSERQAHKKYLLVDNGQDQQYTIGIVTSKERK